MKFDAMPVNYSDFAGLNALKARASQDKSSESLEAAAKQFEAMFIQMMMKSMRDANATMKSGLFDNAGTDMFEEMLDKEFSVKFGEKGALGLADMLVKQLGHLNAASTEQVNPDDLNQQAVNPAMHRALPLTSEQLKFRSLGLEGDDE